MKLIMENWRKNVLKETKKFFYHASPEHDIEEFVPRQFAHKEDFSHSGRWETEETPEGYKLSNLVFASKKQTMPFYSLPRDVPRIEVNLKDKETKRAVYKAVPGFHASRTKIIFLPEEQKSEIETHEWTEYAFEKSGFSALPNKAEFVSSDTVKPTRKKKKKNPIKYLELNGYEVKFVPNIYEIYKILSDSYGVEMNAEGDFEEINGDE